VKVTTSRGGLPTASVTDRGGRRRSGRSRCRREWRPWACRGSRESAETTSTARRTSRSLDCRFGVPRGMTGAPPQRV